MQTRLTSAHSETPQGRRAEEILRKCVHCGFCNATCPTYRLTGDELDGPRGRIYQIKRILEGETATRLTQQHLDRCLTCRNCETTCPAGVEYAELLEIGRQEVEEQVQRPWPEKMQRRLLRQGLVSPLFGPALALGRKLRPWLPNKLSHLIPPLPVSPTQSTHSTESTQSKPARASVQTSAPAAQRQVWLLAGCVQTHLAPNINAATQRVLARCGIQAQESPSAGCCGAIALHLADQATAQQQAKRNIDAWWPAIAAGQIEGLVMTASGCGSMIKEYGRLLAHDLAYAERAARISALTRDLTEWSDDLVEKLPAHPLKGQRLVAQTPCSLQHGQQLPHALLSVLQRLGAAVRPALQDDQQCCGSAGTYAILHAEWAQTLRERKLAALAPGPKETVVSANIGCMHHLQGGSQRPIRHWIEVLDQILR